MMQYYPSARRTQHVIAADAFDLALADRASATPLIREVLAQPAIQAYPPGERLLQDTMLGLYKMLPQLREPGDIAPSHRPNRALLERVMGERVWEELRLRTRLDEALSTLGAVSLSEELLKLLDEETKRQAQEAARAEEEVRRQEAFAEALQTVGDAGDPAARARIQAALAAAAQARQRAEAAAQAVEQAVGHLDPAALRQAVRKARDEVGEQANALASWGLEAGDPRGVSPEERIALAREILNSAKLRRIAALAGRLRNLAFAAQGEKADKTPAEVYGIEAGNDLSRILPQELAALRHPTLRLDFYRRFLERQTLQYALQGREKLALGPLVVCWDESGSMSGEKEIWSKAVALALLAVAQRQKRPWAGIPFSASGQVQSVVFPRPHHQVKSADLVRLASHCYGGGTDFEVPLAEARRIIGEEGDFRRGDIVFITDGIARLSDDFQAEFIAWKRRLGVRVFVVLIDVSTHDALGVRGWADRVERVVGFAQDLTARDAVARAVFGGV